MIVLRWSLIATSPQGRLLAMTIGIAWREIVSNIGGLGVRINSYS